MTHTIGTRHEWDRARRTLLEHEKELTRRGDDLARERRALSWVPVDTDYRFDTEHGSRTLAELFEGRSQLIIYHFMFGPDWDEGCPSCSSIADHIDLPRVHLEHHDVTWTAVSRAPLAVRARRRHRVPHVLCVRPRPRRNVGHVPMARPSPHGRNEEDGWLRRHDAYDQAPAP